MRQLPITTHRRPLMNNASSVEAENREMLPRELVVAAAKFAGEERKRGKLIPNEQMYDIVAKKLGWK